MKKTYIIPAVLVVKVQGTDALLLGISSDTHADPSEEIEVRMHQDWDIWTEEDKKKREEEDGYYYDEYADENYEY
jgi:hypothetical protein